MAHESISLHPDAKKLIVLEAPLLPISATEIRRKIKAGKSIRYLVPDTVREEIERNGYYR
jgi:nicotinate-nucleotide adenylyltransferase